MPKKLAGLTVVAIVLALSHPAFAKVTLYSKEEVLRSVMNSAELEALKRSYGPVTRIDADESESSEALQSFQLTLILMTETPFGERSCFFEGNVLVQNDYTAPVGIVASKIMEPTFGRPSCQK